jgi:hypothetical protein
MTPFYQKSLYQDQATRYFLINGKTELLVAGDAITSDQFTRDVRAEWLGLPSDFEGTVSVYPRQQQIGCWLEYNQHIKRFFDMDLFSNMWVSIRLPLTIVDNRLNPRYRTLQAGTPTTPITSLEQAFNNPAWHFSKFKPETQSINLSELRISVGRTFIDSDYFQLSYETTILIPMGSHQNPKFLFDAFVGLNNHAGFGNKATLQILLNRNPIHAAWTFFVNLEGILLIPNRQHRTFDLRNDIEPVLKQKEWSRFMLFTQQGGAIVPGVNALTRKVTVKPYNIIELSTGWRLNIRSYEFEVGYNLWTHGEERLDFEGGIYEDSSVLPFGILGSAPGITASNSTISTLAPNDASFVAITNGDFERRSAAAATALNHQGHVAFGVVHKTAKVDSFIGAGFFIEVPQVDGALKVWGLWSKIGAAF